MDREQGRIYLRTVEISMVLYTIAAALIVYRLSGNSPAYSTALGGSIMYLNFIAMEWIVGRIIDTLGQKKRYPLLSALKSVAVLSIVGLIVYFQQSMGVYLLIGLFNLFAGALVATILYIRKLGREQARQGE